MAKFETKVGRSKRKTPKENVPRPRKPVHPGIDSTTIRGESRCRKCGSFMSWFAFGPEGSASAALCLCGMWVMYPDGKVRWIRFSSEAFIPSPDLKEVYSP